ncbi:hypothetical protein M1N59_00375 [Dehalococcoidales bacterium]|nr:hypothetical protein [Dehalococcoidales bacterium]
MSMMESFFKTLKHKGIQYESYHDVVTRLPHFIEESKETSLGAWLPNEFEEVVLTH